MVAWHQLSKLRLWFTKLRSRAPPPCPLPAGEPQPQVHSRLLSTLPLEIRLQIYGYIIEAYGTVQHICLSDGVLTHMRCTTSHAFFQTQHARNTVCPSHDIVYRKSVQNGWDILALFLSSRQIYLEFIEKVYSSMTFRIPIPAVAKQFIATVPSRLISLTHLHISDSLDSPMYLEPSSWPVGYTLNNTNPKGDEAYWEGFWRAFAGLYVRVLIFEFLETGIRVPEQALLEPLGQVRAGRFEVVLPWPTGLTTTGDFSMAGFVIRRPTGPQDLMEINTDGGDPWPGHGNRVWRWWKR